MAQQNCLSHIAGRVLQQSIFETQYAKRFVGNAIFIGDFWMAHALLKPARAENRTPGPVASPVGDGEGFQRSCFTDDFVGDSSTGGRTNPYLGDDARPATAGKIIRGNLRGLIVRHKRFIFRFQPQKQQPRNGQPAE